MLVGDSRLLHSHPEIHIIHQSVTDSLGCIRCFVVRHFFSGSLVQRTQQSIFCVSVCFFPQIQGSIRPHAIIILPNSAGTEVLVCYEDEGVYIDTYGRITKDTVLQWGEMPASVGKFQTVRRLL